jgi:hypothetical protein
MQLIKGLSNKPRINQAATNTQFGNPHLKFQNLKYTKVFQQMTLEETLKKAIQQIAPSSLEHPLPGPSSASNVPAHDDFFLDVLFPTPPILHTWCSV